ncbi:hypothetical protein DSL92_01470 [Billgrantia gudaonensis]|uniref:PEP-utilising enzyme C-terminal domain-containing protein n=1 Tax=Billgrantia gudaonensis TaxID=376427 RepID=A0A432JLK1_9GAMM|nr:hypothetical protein DSL92_01470 [Halomonas gudaonensis]
MWPVKAADLDTPRSPVRGRSITLDGRPLVAHPGRRRRQAAALLAGTPRETAFPRAARHSPDPDPLMLEDPIARPADGRRRQIRCRMRLRWSGRGRFLFANRSSTLCSGSRRATRQTTYGWAVIRCAASYALLAPSLAAEVDFFSVGTNGLTSTPFRPSRPRPSYSAQADVASGNCFKGNRMTVQGRPCPAKSFGVCGSQ